MQTFHSMTAMREEDAKTEGTKMTNNDSRVWRGKQYQHINIYGSPESQF